MDVLKALGSQSAGRYAGKPESYGGSRIFHEIWDRTEELARKIFECDYASALPVSGHVAGMMAIDALTKSGDTIATISADAGGYKGYNQDHIPSTIQRSVRYLPFDYKLWNLDLSNSLDLIESQKPDLVILGATVFLFPHPVRKIAECVHTYGGKVLYDGSHVLGLLAGGRFQDPVKEGADLLIGSTHKTLFGPQGGLILSNDDGIFSRIEERCLYTFVDNFHLNRIAALGVALEEAKQHGRNYAKKVIQNSKSLATRLNHLGIPVEAKEGGFTESHQIFLNFRAKGVEVRDTLETNRIISDSRVRLGTNEITRRGMGSKQMKLISSLISDTLMRPNDPKIRSAVIELVSLHRKILFTLDQ